jgi:hypothetical protein
MHLDFTLHGVQNCRTHKTSKVKYGFHLIILIYTIFSFIFKFPLLLFVSTHFISTCNSFSTSSQRGHGHFSVLSLRPLDSRIPSLNHAILLLSCMLHVLSLLFFYIPICQLKINFPSFSLRSFVFA